MSDNTLKLDRLARIEATQERMERKLDLLIVALADESEEEEEEGPKRDLDGNPLSAERQAGDPL